MEPVNNRREEMPASGRLRKRDVIDIYLAKGEVPAAKLAERYHISKTHVYDIWKDKAWEGIEDLKNTIIKRKKLEA